MGFEPTHAGATIRCVNPFTTFAIYGRDSRNWTHTDGFGDRSSTFKLYPYYKKMEGSGFEPPNPKERIYSPPRLARLRYPSIMVARDGIEPPTQGASILCSTDWATEPKIIYFSV